ncbi:hypothetical protein [Streptomyces sp. NBC_00370]|uniref:hypothetical protein n=1 Tax=Streptomyces sp. NBC_00370 TaxID=2975728 RepID=UPI002E26A303
MDLDLSGCHSLKDEDLRALLDLPSLVKIGLPIELLRALWDGAPSPVYYEIGEREVDVWRPSSDRAQKISEICAERLRTGQAGVTP